jgi:SnoaL-like protein
MDHADQLVARYLAAFNETNADARSVLLNSLYSGESTYTDPHVHVQGPHEIGAFIEQTQARFPGYTFRLGGVVDAHHDQARFQWHAGPVEEPDRFVGFDVIVADDGRIRSVYGFMDAAPAA